MKSQSGSPTDPRNPTLECIAAGRRRRILGLLLDRGSPVTERKLATHLAATGREVPVTDELAAEAQSIRTDLVHVQLPMLAGAGLITWDRDGATIGTTGHPALRDPRFRRLLGTDSEGLDTVLSALSHEYRRIVLTVLRRARTAITRTDLAREVIRRETGDAGPESDAVEDALVSLYHTHLPKLAVADLAEYDAATDRVTYTGNPALETVFRIIFEPDEQVVDKLGGFLGELKGSYRQASKDASEQLDWPHFWRKPYHG